MESCTFCEKPVCITERIYLTGHMLHRTCFKCCCCGAQLSMINFYQTGKGDFSCDMCPDDEQTHDEVIVRVRKTIQDSYDHSNNSTPDEGRANISLQEFAKINYSNEINSEAGNICGQEREIQNTKANSNKDDIQGNPATILVIHHLNIQSEHIDNEELSVLKFGSGSQLEDEEIKVDTVESNKEEEKDDIDEKEATCDLKPVNYDEEKLFDVCEKDPEETIYPSTLNPFEDSEDEISSNESTKDTERSNLLEGNDSVEEVCPPIALPRALYSSLKGTGVLKPTHINLNPFGSDFEDDEEIGNNSFKNQLLLSSGNSSPRKKRPAPQPPKLAIEPPIPSPRGSLTHVERRRSGPPPPRPPLPRELKELESHNNQPQQLADDPTERKEVVASNVVAILDVLQFDKATEGVDKKKKGPAPPRPTPPKLPIKGGSQTSSDIEVKQQDQDDDPHYLSGAEGAERGLTHNDRNNMADDLILKLIKLFNEKADLCHLKTELMNMKQEHRLEESNVDLENQIRGLLSKAESLRTEDEKLFRERVIQDLSHIETISQRSEIVNCLKNDDDGREPEEGEAHEVQLGELADVKIHGGEDKSKHRKKLKIWLYKKHDKNADSSEVSDTSPEPSPKKSPTTLTELFMAKTIKNKFLSSLKHVSDFHKKSSKDPSI